MSEAAPCVSRTIGFIELTPVRDTGTANVIAEKRHHHDQQRLNAAGICPPILTAPDYV